MFGGHYKPIQFGFYKGMLYNCNACEDYGARHSKHAQECAVICTECKGRHRGNLHVRGLENVHRVFHFTVPERLVGTLNDKHGILYNDFRLGTMPPAYETV